MALSQTQLDALSVIEKAEHVLLLPSAPIDGDSLGSALSLYLTLKKLGKKATVVAEEAIPASYNFLPEIASISRELKFIRDFVVTIECNDADHCAVRHEIQGNKINIIVTPQSGTIDKEHVKFSEGKIPYDCIITVDTADTVQLGKTYENFTELFHLAPVINIDHHASNLGFGKINLVDIMAPATTVMLLPLIEELSVRAGKPLMDADIATLLLAGLITDTGSFQNPNTTPGAFADAAKLIGYGARQQEIIRNIYKTKKLSTLRLWGRTLTKIQQDEKHKLVWSVLTAKDFAEIGSGPDETEGVIDELMSNAPGAEIVFLLKEKSPTQVGGSVRTLTPTIDASKIAGFFGGGGHIQAAGFKMEKGVVEAEKMIVEKIREFQKERLRIQDDGAPAGKTETSAPAPKPEMPKVEAPAPKPEAPKAIPVVTQTSPPTPVAPIAPVPAPAPAPVVAPATMTPRPPAPASVAPTPTTPTPATPQPPTPQPAPVLPSQQTTVPPTIQTNQNPSGTFPMPPGLV